jgi:hypothetical protein
MFTNEYLMRQITNQVRDEREKEGDHQRLIRSLHLLRRGQHNK